MRSSVALLGLVVGELAAGCGFHSSSGATIDSGAGSDSPGDGGGIDAGCGFAELVSTCVLSFDADLPVMGAATYDTETHLLRIDGVATPVAVKTVMIGLDPVDVISARDVHLGVSASLRAVGSHGLAIIASHDLVLDDDAVIDVSHGGAGARTSCPNGATKGLDNANGGGGGGGGGFGADGGSGGGGNLVSAMVAGGSQGSPELPFPVGFHGGCPGAIGGTGGLPGGAAGQGGGALYLVAGNRIVLSGSATLGVGGGGGQGGSHSGALGKAGGGGGGSGGLLILQAPHIAAEAATIAANGGAGGEGSDGAGAGGNGDPATMTTARASGGSDGAVDGGDGGDGGSSLGKVGGSVATSAPGGGGGGGGSVGFIRIFSPDVMFSAISPLPN
jgi:hypothetical protein